MHLQVSRNEMRFRLRKLFIQILRNSGGPVGAAVGGLAGGTLFDGIVTGVQSANDKKYSPSGKKLKYDKRGANSILNCLLNREPSVSRKSFLGKSESQ